MTKLRAQHLLRAIPLLLLVLIPLRLAGQSAQQSQQTSTSSSWADDVIKQDAYAQPPKELADAVLAPRHLNVTLANLSPDKKWFLDEIGDGPVLMKTFAKPFHELGGVFVDYKANRSRALTIRNNVGIQLISAADGLKKPIQLPAGSRVSNADLVARQHDDRLHAARRRRVAHLGGGRRDRQGPSADEDAAPRHARDLDSSSRMPASRSPRCSCPTTARRCRRRRRRPMVRRSSSPTPTRTASARSRA